ncbi:hypothetical protein ACFVJ8_12440 [Streptomyces yangpuensis]|uniref:hypothetical protein n=1 Tax=Streptomyces TaxID=1883 RepID=UPI000A8E40B8|nr:hypothetical protein [Streptomyces sp. NRRL S-378]
MRQAIDEDGAMRLLDVVPHRLPHPRQPSSPLEGKDFGTGHAGLLPLTVPAGQATP